MVEVWSMVKMLLQLVVLLQLLINTYGKKTKNWNETQSAAKFDNPNFVRDRLKYTGMNMQLPESMIYPDRAAFNPAWMDYCDPHHCNDYHKAACGLNRATLKFKWFQSGCHLILNNMCSNHRGSMKYDLIDAKFCAKYVMDLRSGCPQVCEDEVEPVCGISTTRNHAVLFKNRCSLEMANCREHAASPDVYEDVHMVVCDYYLRHNYRK